MQWHGLRCSLTPPTPYHTLTKSFLLSGHYLNTPHNSACVSKEEIQCTHRHSDPVCVLFEIAHHTLHKLVRLLFVGRQGCINRTNGVHRCETFELKHRCFWKQMSNPPVSQHMNRCLWWDTLQRQWQWAHWWLYSGNVTHKSLFTVTILIDYSGFITINHSS